MDPVDLSGLISAVRALSRILLQQMKLFGRPTGKSKAIMHPVWQWVVPPIGRRPCKEELFDWSVRCGPGENAAAVVKMDEQGRSGARHRRNTEKKQYM